MVGRGLRGYHGALLSDLGNKNVQRGEIFDLVPY